MEKLVDYRVQVTATRGEQLVVERQYQASPDNWVTVSKYLTHSLLALPKKPAQWMQQVPFMLRELTEFDKLSDDILSDVPVPAATALQATEQPHGPCSIDQLEACIGRGEQIDLQPSGVVIVVAPCQCPSCSGTQRGVCTHPWHWRQVQAQQQCSACGSIRPEGFISIDSMGRHECPSQFHNPYNLSPEQILPSTY